MDANPHGPRLSDELDADPDYRPLSRRAMVGLLLGLVSALAFVARVAWFVPPLAVLINLWALRDLNRSDSTAVGRPFALAGLALALMFGSAAASTWYSYRWRVRDAAKPFAEQWFDYLRNVQPQKAHQLTYHPKYRQPLDDTLWEFYRKNPDDEKKLRDYVAPSAADVSPKKRKLVPTLLALGHKADVRYHGSGGVFPDTHGDEVLLVYAVTYEEDGRRKSFFVKVHLKRFRSVLPGTSPWMLDEAIGGIRPEGT